MRRIMHAFVCLVGGLGLLLGLAEPARGQAQSTGGDLVGAVTDPEGARVPGARVRVENVNTGLVRAATTNEEGVYRVLVLPPGVYEVTVEKQGFTPVRNPRVEVRIGRVNQYDVRLQVRPGQETVVVTTETQLIETERTAVAETIESTEIHNLPINQRDYLNFTLLTSTASRDSAPSIGAAPTSGLNFGGQRARSNQVSVDGADYTDNSVNGVRSTVSQEAVQEFQIITNSYMPEFGRALGGIVNIVTKGGTNEFHGNVFGFIRNRNFEARNPFSTVEDPAFTRAQAGFTLGGPVVRDQTFYFFSYEMRRREEEGFTSIGADNFGFVPFSTPVGPVLVTRDQRDFLNDPTAQAIFGGINFLDGFPNTPMEQYLFLAAGSSGTALEGINPFTATGFFITSGAPLPPSFVLLNTLRGNYPVDEATSFWSARLDHRWNQDNTTFLRVNVTPSTVRGLQVNAQNQTAGQNAWSRTSEQSFRDFALVAQHVTTLTPRMINEARFQFARRGLSYTPSRAPGRPGEPLGGEGLGVNIGGFAFFGREPFSRVDRVERRSQWTDNFSLIHGNHTYKFGVDVNFIQVRPRFANDQVFELNFGGVMNFGALSETVFGFPDTAGSVDVPGFSAVQSYGLGLPQSFVQGIGDSFSAFDNTAVAFYGQDSWRVRPNLTFNYGVRWEGEFTPRLEPFNELTAQAEQALGVTEGIPRDWNNVQPRLGLAWDPWSTGQSVVRASYGIFFDHPLLAIAFNSDTADGAQSAQQILFGGAPCPTSILLDPRCLNAASIFQGILNAPPSFGYEPAEQRFDPFLTNSIFINQNFCPQPSPDPARTCTGFPLPILPFTLPVDDDFVFGYAQQWNLTFERQFWQDFSFSIGYQGVKGNSLNRPRNINAPINELLLRNFNNAFNTDPAVFGGGDVLGPGFDPRRVQVPAADPGFCVLFIPATFCLTDTGLPIGTAAAFNFFRPSGPNLAFTGGLGIPDAAIFQVAELAGYPTGPGFFVPFSDVNQQESTGHSIYHGMTVTVQKRMSRFYQFLASYTWSHAIDDSTDLQTLLNPQNNRRPDLERGDSTFDQRHRFVFSGVFQSPFDRASANVWHKIFADFTVAPIFEASAGRPFTVLTGSDTNMDFGPNTDRPSVVPAGTPGAVESDFVDGVAFIPPTNCPAGSNAVNFPFGCTGTLGRNTFTRPEVWSLDLRVARSFYFGERWSAEFIVDMFNLFNRFNVSDVNPLCNPLGKSCIAGQPTSVFDTRQFQFGFKLNW